MIFTIKHSVQRGETIKEIKNTQNSWQRYSSGVVQLTHKFKYETFLVERNGQRYYDN